ncbi:MAG: DoxX family protein [Rhodospirillales bacterium]|nr:DoxX family protein [Rhodospirillales bacterium]
MSQSTQPVTDAGTAPYGVLILRLLCGVFFLIHAGIKLFLFGPAGTEHFFAFLGLPGWFGLVIIAVESLGGIALILGVFTRWVALVLAADLIGAIVLVHAKNGFVFTAKGGGYEYPLFWAITLIALAALGNGRFALGSPRD